MELSRTVLAATIVLPIFMQESHAASLTLSYEVNAGTSWSTGTWYSEKTIQQKLYRPTVYAPLLGANFTWTGSNTVSTDEPRSNYSAVGSEFFLFAGDEQSFESLSPYCVNCSPTTSLAQVHASTFDSPDTVTNSSSGSGRVGNYLPRELTIFSLQQGGMHYPWSSPDEGISSGSASINGTLDFTYDLGDDGPGYGQDEAFIVVESEGASSGETSYRKFIPYDPNSTDLVGTVDTLVGSGKVTRADGTEEVLEYGTNIYLGDTVETAEDGTINLRFVDESTFSISEKTTLEIDEYVYEPVPAGGAEEFTLDEGIFVYTNGLIGRRDSDDVKTDQPIGSLGFRADASDPVKEDLLNNPNSEFGDWAIWFESASPVGVSTIIDIPEPGFQLDFGYSFLSAGGVFSLLLGDVEILNWASSEEAIGLPQFFSGFFDFEMDLGLEELSFVYDGDAGLDMLLWDISVDGQEITDFSRFGRIGAGPVETIWMGTESQFEALNSAITAPVPLPSSVWALLLSCLSLAGLRRWRHQGVGGNVLP